MASNIDVSVPTPVRATTKSVRDNFIAAKEEIEALQDNESAIGADILDEKNRNDAQDLRLDQLEEDVGNIDISSEKDRNDAQDLRLDQLEEDVDNIEVTITTSMVETEVGDGTREAEPSLTNQKEVNNYLWETVSNLEPYDDEEIQKSLEELQEQIDALFEATKPEPERLPIFAEDEPTEYPHVEEGEPNDLAPKDQWYQVTDPDFDYDNPTTDGLALYIWTDVEGEFEWVLFEVEIPKGVVIIKPELPDMEEDAVNNGSLWFDNSENTMQLFVYHSDSSAWLPVAPPTTLEGRVSQGEAVQQAIIAQINHSLNEQSVIEGRVKVVEGNQQNIQSDFVALEHKVNMLEGVVGEHRYNFTADQQNVRAGQFNIQTAGMQLTSTVAEAEYLSLSNTDAGGKPVDLPRIVEGDVVRLYGLEGQVVEFKVLDSNGTGFMQVEVITAGLATLSEFPYDFVLLSSFDPAGLATVSYVDARDETKLGNSGTNQLPDDTDWKVKQHNSEGKNKTLIHSVGGQLGVYNLKEPSESHHAATKAYVDANSGDNSGVPARPPGLKFMVMIQDALPGYFNWWVRSSTNQQHLELNTTDRDGIVWGADIPREDVRYSDDIPFTVWEVVGGGWKMKVTGTISRIDFHPTHTLCYVSSHTALNGGNFVDNSGPYYITIGGII